MLKKTKIKDFVNQFGYGKKYEQKNETIRECKESKLSLPFKRLEIT